MMIPRICWLVLLFYIRRNKTHKHSDAAMTWLVIHGTEIEIYTTNNFVLVFFTELCNMIIFERD